MKAAPVIHAALKRLEYRGYDSVGIATIHDGKIYIKKDSGKIDDVHKLLNLDDMPGNLGIGHTRWATHGAPYQVNAHPHTDCKGEIAVVHNGIIENFSELRSELEDLGHEFKSKTDTEVIPHLIEENMKKGLGLVEAVREALKVVRGSYAIAVISSREPDKIVCARMESPLILGIGEDAVYCASDIPAFLPLTKRAVVIENGEIAVIRPDGYEIRRVSDWSLVERKPETIEWTAEMAEKQGYPHFMLKEIHEQPECLRNTLRLQDKYLDLMATFLDRAREIFLVAAGTSYHACLAASYMFSKLAYLAAHPVIASEFIEQEGMAVNINSTILAVSQSGETADTLEAVEYARDHGLVVFVHGEDSTRAKWSFERSFINAVADAGASVYRICDTIGVATSFPEAPLPNGIFAKIRAIKRETKIPNIEIHAHDDLGNAVENTMAAIRAANGLYDKIFVSTTVLGMGERAGNAETEKVIVNLYFHHGFRKFEHGLSRLKELADFVSAATGVVIPPNKAIVGTYAFAHESGIHTHGVLRDARTYEFIPPELVGNTRRISIGKQSGKAVIRYKAEEVLGRKIDEDDPRILRLVELVRSLYASGERKSSLKEEEFKKLMVEAGFKL